MKIIKKGNKTTECECGQCGCVMEYDPRDIKHEIDYMCISLFFPTRDYFKREYINCPQCGNKITVGRCWL